MTLKVHIAPVFIVPVLALLGLGMQPGICCNQDALCRSLYGPGLRSAIVILEKTRDGGLAGDVADLATADPVSDSDGNAFRAELRFFRYIDAVKVLIRCLATFVRILPDG